MNNSQGALYFSAGIDMREWRNNIQEMRRDILGVSNTAITQTRQIDNSSRIMGRTIAAYFSGAALGNFANQIINVRGEFQKTEIAFGTMLKSTDKAKALMGQMVELAAKTPFSLQDVSAGAKQLLAFQVPAEEVVDTLTRMGNIAAGLGVPLSRINLVYGQVMAKGKLAGDDLRQFTEAGIPMLAELAKKFNTSTAEISKMVTAGKIGFKDVKEVLFSLTNEGGMFFNLMELQSKSLSGQMANLGDAWDQMLNSIGEANQDILSGAIQEAVYLIENYKGVLEIIEGLVLVYGAYRAAIIVNTVALKVAAAQEAGLTVAQIIRTGATNAATTATALLNTTMLANPFVLVTTLLAGLVVVLYRMNSQATYAAELQQKYNEKITEGAAGVQQHKAKVEALITAIKSENTTNEQRSKLMTQLSTLTNGRLGQLTAEAIRTGKATDAINSYIGALDREARAKAVVDLKAANYKRKIELENEKNPTFSAKASTIFDANTYKNASGNVTAASVWNALTEKSIESYERNKILEIKAIDEQDAKFDKYITANAKDLVENVSKIGDNTAAATKEIAEKNKRDLAEIFSLNSIADLEQRIALWNEAKQKASGDNVQELTKNKFGDTVKTGKTVSVKTANDEIERLEKAKAIRSKELQRLTFDEQIMESERQWNNYYKLAEFYGKEIANAQYKDLLGGSASYLEYLQKEQEALKSKPGILTDEEKQSLIFITEKINSLTGAKTPLQNWKNDINDALRGVVSLAEQIEILENKDAEILQSEGGTTSNYLAFKRENDAQIEATKNQIKDNYTAFLAEHQSYEEQKTAITKKFDDLRAADTTGANTEIIDKAELEELSKLSMEILKRSADWQTAFGDMEFISKSALKRIEQSLLKFKEVEGKTLAPTELRELEEALKRVQEAQNSNPFSKIIGGFEDLKNAKDEVYNATERYNAAVKVSGANSSEAIKASEELAEADRKQAAAKKKIFDGIQDGQKIFNAVGDGLLELGDLFGGFDDATKDAIGNIMAIGNAAMDFGKALLNPSDIGGMIKAGVALIGSVFKALNGDQKKERQIKKQAASVKLLEQAYNDLAFAAERLFGSQKYDGQRDLIKNLEQQKAAIQQMMALEKDKKKADGEKIAEYQSQIQGINQSIQTLKEGIIKDVLQTDIPSMASSIGDALIEAFSKGEDGIEAVNRAFDDMVKNILKNQLNKVLEKQMSGVYQSLLNYAGFDKDGNGTFNGFSPEELADIRAQYQTVSQHGAALAEAIAAITGGAESLSEGMKGDIKGITEKTAGALEAQINTMRIYQAEALAIHRNNQAVFLNSLNNLIQIEFNTRRLHNIDATLAEMNGKMSKGLAGIS